MTNHNERLDEILRSLAHQAYLTAHAPGYTKLDGRTYKTAVDEAKQAITSLIKELVAEARIDELNDVPFEADSPAEEHYKLRIAELSKENE